MDAPTSPFQKQKLAMAKFLHPQTLVSLLLMMMLANCKLVHSQTSFTFSSFSQNQTGLTYQGDAHVPPECKFVRLVETSTDGTPGSKSVGRVLYSEPVQLWGGSSAVKTSFRSLIKFVIRQSSGGAADGLTFFMAPVGTTIPPGADSANLGIFNSSGLSPSLFAVEFDTWVNQWDPNYPHIGIDFESRESSNSTYFDSASTTFKEVTVSIEYNAATGLIDVEACSTCGSNVAQLSYISDLTKILPEQVQVGISASTGAPVTNNAIPDLLFWSFTSTVTTNHKIEEYSSGTGKFNLWSVL